MATRQKNDQSSARQETQRPANGSKRKDELRAFKFVEELSWLLNTYSDLDFRTLSEFRKMRNELAHSTPTSFERYVPRNPNVFFLVGTLPGLFTDENLFPTNEDLADFAATALGVQIPRWSKKSKFELIGHIVCHTSELDDSRVERLVVALAKIVSGDKNARSIVGGRKKAGLSWNEIIQRLTDEPTNA